MENNSKLNEMIAELNANGFTVYDKYITSSRIENIRMGAIKHYTKDNKVNYKAVAIDDELNLREEFLLTNAATAIRELIKQGRSDLAQAKYDRAFRKLAAQSISYASMKNDFADCEHEILGFYGDSYFGNNIVSKEQGTSIKSCFINENVKLGQSGDLTVYRDATNNFMKGKAIVQTVLAYSLSGIFISRNSGIIRDINDAKGMINLSGKSGVGKTTLEKIALAVHGNPNSYINYLGTSTSILNRIYENQTVVSCIDDIQQNPDIQINTEAGIRQFIFALTSPQTKTKSSPRGSLIGGDYVYSPVIVSSVDSLLDNSGSDKGQVARTLELEIERDCIAKNVLELNNYFSILNENYGLLAEYFAQKLFDNEKQNGSKKADISINYDRARNALNNKLVDERYSNRASVILTTAATAKQLGILNFDNTLIFNFLVDNINSKVQQFGKTNKKLDKKFADKRLADYFVKYKKYFHEGLYKENEDRDKTLGIYEKIQDGGYWLTIPDDKQRTILPLILNDVEPAEIISMVTTGDTTIDMNELCDIKDVLSFWKKIREILETGARKGYKHRLTLVEGMENETCYRVKLGNHLFK